MAFEWLFEKMRMKNMSDWYKVKVSNIIEHGGSILLDRYQDSLCNALMKVYPSHSWHPWRFGKMPLSSLSSSTLRTT